MYHNKNPDYTLSACITCNTYVCLWIYANSSVIEINYSHKVHTHPLEVLSTGQDCRGEEAGEFEQLLAIVDGTMVAGLLSRPGHSW